MAGTATSAILLMIPPIYYLNTNKETGIQVIPTPITPHVANYVMCTHMHTR